jgi:hypothetical protein
MEILNTKIHKYFNFITNIAILATAYIFIYFHLFHQKSIYQEALLFVNQIENQGFPKLISIVIVLMLLNWSIEAIKWRYLIRRTENVSFLNALKGVITGITTSILTPNRVGDFVGKAFILSSSNHGKAVSISLLGSLSQLLITISIGFGGFVLLIALRDSSVYEVISEINIFIIFLIFLVIILLFLFYFNVSFFIKNIIRLIPLKWQWLYNYLEVLLSFTAKELNNTLLLSFLRYVVFSIQLFILFRIFGFGVSITESLIISSSVFFLLAFIPSIALAEIGIRGSVIIVVLNIFNYSSFKTEAFAAITFLWIINILIPALAGSAFVWELKFFKKQSDCI